VDSSIRGAVTDRPWGITLAALGLEGRTGQLTLHGDDGRIYRVAFYRGAIVAASSPVPADAPVRVALTTRMITPAQATELKQRVRRAVGRDEIEMIAQTLGWPAGQADQLRAAVIVRCAARTFAVEQGSYVLEDRIAGDALGAIGEGRSAGQVDVRAAVYLGIRMHLSDVRLACDLRQLGAWFVLKPKTVVDLTGFGFTETEAPILDALRGGTNLAELEARHRDVDPRAAQAVIYALATCDAVVCCEPPVIAAATEVVFERTEPVMTRVPTPRSPTIAMSSAAVSPGGAPALQTSRVPTPRAPTLSTRETSPWGLPTTVLPRVVRETQGPGAFLATGTPAGNAGFAAEPSRFGELRTTTVRPAQLAVQDIEALIVERIELLDRGVDHFTLLGLPGGATPEQARSAYIELARYLEPRHLAALGIRDDSYSARRLFAQICIAVTVLTDPIRRREYVAALGG
jgi:hypothetical protein